MENLSKIFLIEDRGDPWFRFHLIIIAEKPLPKLDQGKKSKKTNKAIGIGVRSTENLWLMMAPSPYLNTEYNYRTVNASELNLATTKEYDYIINLIERFCAKHLISYGSNSKLIVMEILQKYYDFGSRNDLILSFAGFLRKNNVEYEEALEIVETLCDEAFDEEKEARLDLVARTYKIEDPKELTGYSMLREMIIDDKDFSLLTTTLGISNNTKNRTKKEKDKNPSKDEIISELQSQYEFAYVIESKDFLYYRNGIYIDYTKELIEREIESNYPNQFDTNEIKEIVDTIQRTSHVSINDFDKDINILNLPVGLSIIY